MDGAKDNLGLSHQRVVLGVTGGVAAYKACELVRRLRRAGNEVQVVMTRAATRFVGAHSFQALSGRSVRIDLFDPAHEAAMGHIELARWADLLLVAPATADFLARLAHGRADDLLTTLCLATEAPLVVAPAMNHRMWRHPATQDNVRRLAARGVRFIGPESGEQACGEIGPGRMSEPEAIVAALDSPRRLFPGERVLVTAGPTHEPLDPVRFLGNRSSGRMGFALARAFVEAGADVTLIAGPVALETPPGVDRVDVETALEMHRAVFERIEDVDLFAACAAVADYRPASPSPRKIKKSSDILELRLVRNPDILGDVAALEDGPFTLGFAAETEELEAHARAKLRAKRVDVIAANAVGPGLAFGTHDNALEVFWEGGHATLPRQDKHALARRLVALVSRIRREREAEARGKRV